MKKIFLIAIAIIGLGISANAQGYQGGEKCATKPSYPNNQDGYIQKSVTVKDNDNGTITKSVDYKCKSIYD